MYKPHVTLKPPTHGGKNISSTLKNLVKTLLIISQKYYSVHLEYT